MRCYLVDIFCSSITNSFEWISVDHWNEIPLLTDSKVKTKSVITEYFETVAPEDVLNVIYADDDELLDLNSAEDMIPETISEMRASAPEAVISLTDMNIIRKADSILNSLLADLDQFGDQVIYSDGFIEKLLTLTQIHQGQDVIDIIDTDDESIWYRQTVLFVFFFFLYFIPDAPRD